MDELEELFPPRPGGMVDSARKAAAAAPAPDAGPGSAEVTDGGYPAIRIAAQGSDRFAARGLTVAAGATVIALPEDPNRKRAVLLVATASSTVILSQASGNADNGTGFALPDGIPLAVEGRGVLYLNNPGGSSVSVSVLAELYAPGV